MSLAINTGTCVPINPGFPPSASHGAPKFRVNLSVEADLARDPSSSDTLGQRTRVNPAVFHVGLTVSDWDGPVASARPWLASRTRTTEGRAPLCGSARGWTRRSGGGPVLPLRRCAPGRRRPCGYAATACSRLDHRPERAGQVHGRRRVERVGTGGTGDVGGRHRRCRGAVHDACSESSCRNGPTRKTGPYIPGIVAAKSRVRQHSPMIVRPAQNTGLPGICLDRGCAGTPWSTYP